MKHIILPLLKSEISVRCTETGSLRRPDQQRLVFFLAMEEWLAKHEDEAFFIWQSAPTVICGRNQIAEAEINLKWCREHGIEWYRRKSGGGCVYSDSGNLMLSYITATENAAEAFTRYLDKLVDVLNSLGVPAERSGRNDILVDGRKVSGNSFYSVAGTGKSIVHGTLLYDTDFDNMTNSITPSETKLSGHAVESVRQRVTLLKDYLHDMTVPELKTYIVDSFCDSSRTLSEDDVQEIKSIEQGYLEDSFRYGHNPSFSLNREMKNIASNERKLAGAGIINVNLNIKRGVIASIRVSGDYFEVKPGFEEELDRRLEDCLYETNAIQERLEDFPAEDYVYGLTAKDLIGLLIDC